MAQLVLENFKYGLEYRRSELTANPGALFDALNCFVNDGGEMERRRAFFPMSAFNSTEGFMKPADGLGPSATGGGARSTIAGAEFENGGCVFIGDFGLTETQIVPGLLPAAYSGNTAAVRQYLSYLFQYSLANVVTLVDPGGSVLHIQSAFGYNVTLTTLINTSALGTITYTNNTTADVTITIGGTWATGDHIQIRVAQTNYSVDVGYGTGPITAYPTFTSYSIFGGGTTPPSSYMQLSEPLDAQAVITDLTTCTFAGKVFCVATWNTGRTYEYYKGTILADSLGVGIYAGLIGATDAATQANIASYIAAMVNFYGASMPGAALTAVALANVVTLSSAARNISISSTENSTLGVATVGANGTAAPTLTITGTWLEGDRFTTLTATVAAAGAIDISGGALAGLTPTFCYTFGTKVYLLERTSTYFSAVNSGTDFATGGSGAGNIDLSKQDTLNDTLVTCCAYQGNLAFFFKNSIQIWNMDANDLMNQRVQALGNTGAVGKYAICPIGNLDVIYMDSGGIRSLRPRVASENALPFDVGAPINKQVRSQLKAKTCLFSSIVMGYDPTNQLLFVTIPYHATAAQTVIYNCSIACWTLSYFPDSKVIAWSGTELKYASCVGAVATQQQMWPQKFITWHSGLYFFGRFYHVLSSGTPALDICLATYDPTNVGRTLYAAGYDNSVPYFITPFLNAKSPGVRKQSNGADIICSGGWTLSACMSPAAGTFTDIVTVGSAGTSAVVDSSTPDGPGIGFDTSGNHIQFKATGTVASVTNDLGLLATTPGQQIFSQLIWYYDAGGAKD